MKILRRFKIYSAFMLKTCAGKYFFFLLAIMVVSASCKKDGGDDGPDGDGDNTEFYIRFKADGTAADYKSNAITQVLPVSQKKLYSCMLQGYKDFTVTNNNLMSLVIWSENPIAAKTYRNADNAVNSDNEKIPQVLITYLDGNKVSYQSQGVFLSSLPPFDKILSNVVVTITEVSQSRIAGSFSGTLYKATDATFSTTVKITDGKFNLKRL
jgi:hypothetical protein